MKFAHVSVRRVLAAMALLAGCIALPPVPPAGAAVDRGLREMLAAAGPSASFPVIVRLAAPPDDSPLPADPARSRRPLLVRRLRDAHERSSRGVAALLAREGGGPATPLWAINAVALRATPGLVARLAALPEVARVQLDALVYPPRTEPAATGTAPEPAWNLDALRIRELWDLGHTGAGATVAVLDTGVDPLHADLAGRWRGLAGDWFDPYGQHASPADPPRGAASGHGTAVAGIAVGGDAGGTPIGAAPDANWIAAKIFDDAGVGTLSGIHQALQWALDPDDDPDTDDAPQVVNGSFGFPSLAGECYAEFEPDVALLRAAGIAVVFSAGNSGPAPMTSLSPGNNAGAVPVGAVGATLDVAAFSSRGPSACGGGLFPALVAPGTSVTSADLTSGGLVPLSYAARTGTSFAAPHVSGLIALLAAAWPDATTAQLEEAITATALDLGPPGPDDAAGHGLPDAVRAWRVLGGLPPCPDGDGDGYFPWEGCGTAVDCRDDDAAVHPGAAEVARDGIDQDCNGYDLTIRVRRAVYRRGERRLLVRAASDLGRRASLRVAGLGRMSWSRSARRWTLELRGLTRPPRTLLVRGPEGAVSVPVRRR